MTTEKYECPLCLPGLSTYSARADRLLLHATKKHALDAKRASCIIQYLRWSRKSDVKLCALCDQFAVNLRDHYAKCHAGDYRRLNSLLTGQPAIRLARKRALRRFGELYWCFIADQPLPRYPDSSYENEKQGLHEREQESRAGKQSCLRIYTKASKLLPAKVTVQLAGEKGYGLFSDENIKAKSFVCFYGGAVLSKKEGAAREEKRSREGDSPAFAFFYFYGSKSLCEDATLTDSVGRYINHSRLNPNLVPSVISPCKDIGRHTSRIGFFALHNIPKGIELLYDYGERDEECLQKFPWLNS
ncbi:hypothetical protein BOX15_Mlig001681g4 [Macrostomum lignano]|uniref:SET domain-containing protein n=1 Tax=Macrostomum lignano TaxID=282301 RepID=A0A267FWA0_9PLAT|nr:hypothetical protein BOX15_Mlig001681g17 [Macrostomum lignano]PAA68010.1 hypothetical protein BOX15_Mlig001681g8 [Macrostomum lignano]PAA77514.1 hypothetical protein BOX15_Mlig001681g31 [Macrostomum lignano]PAA90834.1 hypothetical protein BOX15_Mlig001681g4 [Macrostomum lignano]